MADYFLQVAPIGSNEWLNLPYPKYESGLQQISTIVDSARTADGIVRGVKVGKDQSKVNLTWAKLSPAEWSTILTFFDNNFKFKCRYIDMVSNSWVTRIFYVGDRQAQPFLVDKTTNRPKWYLNCQANVIDTGERL